MCNGLSLRRFAQFDWPCIGDFCHAVPGLTLVLQVQIDGVWHSAIVVGGREFYFGGGIQEVTAGRSPFGQPLQVIKLG